MVREEAHPIQTHCFNFECTVVTRKASLTKCCHAVEAVMSCLTRQSINQSSESVIYHPVVKQQLTVVNVVVLMSGGIIWAGS